MGKVFEDYLAEAQTEMVALALEYVPDARKVFVHADFEGNSCGYDTIYDIDGELYKRGNVGRASGHSYDTSDEAQSALMDYGTDEVIKLKRKCDEFGQPMPTEIKLVYDAEKNSLEGNLSYDLKYSNTKDKLAHHIYDEWFEELKAQYEAG
jgi:hypothetical protein